MVSKIVNFLRLGTATRFARISGFAFVKRRYDQRRKVANTARVCHSNIYNVSRIKYDDKNEVSVFVDPDNGDEGGVDHGSGWWYEGGGLYRNVYLHRASNLHIESDGLFAYSNITWNSSDSSIADSATIHVSADVTNQGDSSVSDASVVFMVSDDRTRSWLNRIRSHFLL